MASSEIDLTGILGDYASQVKKQVEEAQDEVAQEAVDALKSASPRGRSGKYAKGWAMKREGRAVKVYNKKHYSLTHLLEFGHATRDGGRTRAKVHIAPVEQQAIKSFESKVRKAVEDAGR